MLVFVGAKMLLAPHGDGPHKWFQFEVSTLVSLVVIGVILATAMLLRKM